MSYDSLRHDLDTKMLNAANLLGDEPRMFVIERFKEIHSAYKAKQVHHEDYLKLVNRLASYQLGAFNDFLDTLVGGAQFGLLDIVIARSVPGGSSSPEATRQRSGSITRMTGMPHSETDNG